MTPFIKAPSHREYNLDGIFYQIITIRVYGPNINNYNGTGYCV
jgi:hypothetical protein